MEVRGSAEGGAASNAAPHNLFALLPITNSNFPPLIISYVRTTVYSIGLPLSIADLNVFVLVRTVFSYDFKGFPIT